MKFLNFKCPILEKEGYTDHECDLPEFKKGLWERGLSCQDKNGHCLGERVRKIMFRIDNPERKVAPEELEKIIKEIEQEKTAVA